MGIGENGETYRKIFEGGDSFFYLVISGNFKADQLIDIIFQHPKVPYMITRKILKCFIFDNLAKELVQYYGSYFKEVDFDIKTLLTKILQKNFPNLILVQK